MDPSVITTLKAANEVSGLLATIAKLKDKLLANPSSAAEKLAYALNEVGKTFQVVETELVRFLVLGASPEALKNAMNSGDNPLYVPEGPKLRSRVAEGRGSSFLIGSYMISFSTSGCPGL
jgi:hypothetical protein